MTEETQKEAEKVIHSVVENEMKQAYVDYAMSVIVGRALPDARDGLKPVHRRILYSMHDEGLRHDKAFKKSAHIVGDVLARFHPHGDMAVYNALVRMTQDFSLRYPLIEGQGNFGSIDGDSAAAYRYTEARLNLIAEEMLADIDKDTVDFTDNFDGSSSEPDVLPTKIPNLLVNGSSGIAVGMATNIPPHNLGEVCDAVNLLIDNPEATIDEIMEVLPGPDFPTGATLTGKKGIEKAYKTGKGKVTLKAEADIEEDRIIVNAIPYMVNKAKMIEKIAGLVKDDKVEGIRDIRDESDKEGIRVVIEVKRGHEPEIVLNQLYKYSRMKTTFGIMLLALVDDEPKVLNVKEALEEYISHRKEVIRRRTQYKLDKAEKREHIVSGLITALDNIEEVIDGIQDSESTSDAGDFLVDSYDLSEEQADAILDMRLQKLASLEQQNFRNELEELEEEINEYKSILSSEQRILDIIQEETSEMKEEYGDERRTQIVEGEEDIDMEQLIEEERMVVTRSKDGYVKRISLDEYRSQRRGGRGVIAAGTKEGDWVEDLFVTSTHNHILFFTDKGQVKWLKTYKIPEASRQARGTPIVNLLDLEDDESITAAIPVSDFDSDKFVFMATKQGKVKKTSLEDFSRPRKGGIRAIKLEEGNELVDVDITDGSSEIVLATREGMAIRFSEEDVRGMGRNAMGVKGINLEGDDYIVGSEVVDENTVLFTATTKGYGKRTNISEYSVINRGGKGVKNAELTDKTGMISDIETVDEDDELMFISKEGIAIRTKASEISKISRSTQGVKIMDLEEGDNLTGVAKIPDDVE